MAKKAIKLAWVVGGVVVLVTSFVLGRQFTLKSELPGHMARVEQVVEGTLVGGQAKMASLHVSLYQNLRAGNLDYVESALCQLIKADATLLADAERSGDGIEDAFDALHRPHVAGALTRTRDSGCAPG